MRNALRVLRALCSPLVAVAAPFCLGARCLRSRLQTINYDANAGILDAPVVWRSGWRRI